MLQVHSCDMNLALCLQKAGYMFTQPGHALLHGAASNDPRFILFDNPLFQAALRDPAGALRGALPECRDTGLAGAAAVRSVLDGNAAALASVAARAAAGQDSGAGSPAAPTVGAESRGPDAAAAAAAAAADDGPWQQTSSSSSSSSLAQLGRRSMAAAAGSPDAAAAAPGGGGNDGRFCRWLAKHAVSVHMHGRSFASVMEAAAAMRAVAQRHHEAVVLLAAEALQAP
jgi:hypothetical protein